MSKTNPATLENVFTIVNQISELVRNREWLATNARACRTCWAPRGTPCKVKRAFASSGPQPAHITRLDSCAGIIRRWSALEGGINPSTHPALILADVRKNTIYKLALRQDKIVDEIDLRVPHKVRKNAAQAVS